MAFVACHAELVEASLLIIILEHSRFLAIARNRVYELAVGNARNLSLSSILISTYHPNYHYT